MKFTTEIRTAECSSNFKQTEIIQRVGEGIINERMKKQTITNNSTDK